MREIKFRVFDKVLNQMLNNVSGLVQYKQFFQIHIGVSGMMTRNYEQAEIMQFTELHDKNGKEIYEGDILKFNDDDIDDYKIIVEWSEKFASFVLNRKGWMFSHWFGESCEPNQVEIIGNIYENKDLI